MPITVTRLKGGVSGNNRYQDFTVNFDSSYPTGGEAIAAADWITIGGHGMTAAKCQMIQSESDAAGNRIALDRTNDKFVLFAAGAQAGNGTDQSLITIRARCWYDNQFG